MTPSLHYRASGRSQCACGRSALGARAPLVTSDAALATCGLCRYALRWRHALTRPLRLPEPRVRSVRKGDAA